MCKKKVLSDYLDNQKLNNIIYTSIIYIGDGGNDYCPLIMLNK